MRRRRCIKDPVLFVRCMQAAACNKELLAEFDRLTGFNVSQKGPGIVQEIDRATGYLDQGARAFYEFVVDCVYRPVQELEDRDH